MKYFRYLKYLYSVYSRKFIFFLLFGAIRPSLQPIIKRTVTPHTYSISADSISIKIEDALKFANRFTLFPAPRQIRFTDGMSGQRFRAFLNFLANSLNKFKYLEIGVWKGSTAKSVLYGTECKALLIDDWSQFGGPYRYAKRTLKPYLESNSARILEADFNSVDFEIKKHEADLYFFDGPHDSQSHINGVLKINLLKSKLVIFIVDDWNWNEVQTATRQTIKTISYNVIKEWEITPNKIDKLGQFGSWHNGIYIVLLEKNI